MKSKIKPILITLLLLCEVFAQTSLLNHYTTKNGLSNNNVYCALQDKQGYLWFGTRDGLNRYDGYNFKVFEQIPFEKNTLSDSYITCMVEDNNNNLWIGTANGGVNVFSLQTLSVKKVVAQTSGLVNNGVWAIIKDRNGNIWIGSEKGLDYYNSKTGKIIHFLSNTYIISLFEDSNNNIWAGTGSGVYCLNNNGTVIKKFSQTKDINSLSDNRVWTIYEDESNKMWFGTQSGLNSYSPDKNKFSRYFTSPDKNNPDKNFIVPIFPDSKKNFWIGTIGEGLFRFENNTLIRTGYLNNKSKIWSIIEDKSGCIWFSTSDGIYKMNDTNQFFGVFAAAQELNVTAILKDEYTIAGTRDNGIFIYNNSGSNYKRLLDNEEITCLLPENKRLIWAGTRSGLYLTDIHTKTIVRHLMVSNASNSITHNGIQCLTKDFSGNLWIGTNEGLNKLNVKSNKITRYFSGTRLSIINSDIITCLHTDSNGNIWIGTQNGGFTCINPINDNILFNEKYSGRPTSLSHNFVRVIFEDSKSNIWIGTASGLNKFYRDKKIFELFTKKNGLTNNVINGITEDDNKNLWITTNNGLNKLNLYTKNTENYYDDNGLKDNEFSINAITKNANTIYTGSKSGMTYFTPITPESEFKIQPAKITSVIKLDTTINLGFGDKDKALIEVNYKNNYVEIYFNNFDYQNISKVRYQFYLDGYENILRQPAKINSVKYVNLPYGEYIFKVKSTSSDGLYTTKESELKISVVPPFWLTKIFLIPFILILLTLIISLIYIRIRSIINIQKIRSDIASDLHDGIGTNITGIIMLSNLLKMDAERGNRINNEYINQITDSAKTVIGDMSDIVWLTKTCDDTSIKSILTRINNNFAEICKLNDINFSIVSDENVDELQLKIENKKNLYMILKEGINNAVRHSKCSELTITIKPQNDMIHLTIKDNGTGFDPDKAELGNGLFNLKKRAERLKGRLIISSEPAKGCKLDFQLKIK